MIRMFSLIAIVAATAVTVPAHAQSRRELAERIDATEVRIGELEDQFMAGDPVAETLMQRMDALDFQVRELTGETERLAFENRQLRQQVELLQAELDAARAPVEEVPVDDEASAWMSEGLNGDEMTDDGDMTEVDASDEMGAPADPIARARAEATGTLGGGPVDDTSDIGDETMLAEAAPVDPATVYSDARARLLDGDFAGAQSGFETFVNEHPEHAQAGEAWYWLGETFFVRDDFTDAADAYIASLRSAPEGPKAPDALVRLAASLYGLGRQDDACATLARFGRQFPNASAESRQRAARESVRANCR